MNKVVIKRVAPAEIIYGDRATQYKKPAKYGVFLGGKRVGVIIGKILGYRGGSRSWDVITEQGRLLKTCYQPNALTKAKKFAMAYRWSLKT